MPIYEYRCESCGHQEEHLQKASDPTLTRCPSCSAESYSRLLSAAGFQLKGSGWYATDFKPSAKPREKSAGESGDAAAPSTPCGGSCACH